jgi:hypothetical protein
MQERDERERPDEHPLPGPARGWRRMPVAREVVPQLRHALLDGASPRFARAAHCADILCHEC